VRPRRSFSFPSLSASFLVAAILIICCLLIRIVDPPPLPTLRLIAFDTWQRAAPRLADPSFPAKVVAIDEKSLKQFGQWPWNRSVVADLVSRIRGAGAKSIALDLVFAEADRFPAGPDTSQLSSDDRLAAAVSSSRAVLAIVGDARGSVSVPAPKAALAATGTDPRSSIHRFPAAVLPMPVLADAAAGIGAVNWFPERDQIVRRVPLLVSIADRVYPSLALEALRVGIAESTVLVQSAPDSGRKPPLPAIEAVKVGKYALPVDPNGELWMRFAAADPRRSMSAADVLEGKFDRAELAGRHVIVGATAIGLSDVRATPLASDTPGVEIHAQALEQIIAGESITRPDYMLGVELTLLLVLGIAVALILGRFRATPAAFVTSALIVGVMMLSSLSYNHWGLLIDPTYPSLTTALMYLGCSLTSYLETERDRNRIRTAFSHYLDPAMVEQLAREPDKLKLGGEMRDITVLFVDVRNFTRRSESMNAAELVQFVNRLFTPLTESILTNKGTIDKYMGDGILAFWNAPLGDPRHPENACRAALAMRDALPRFNRGDPTLMDEPVRIGIGINTGHAVVGNVGSPRRFDYSVLGEVVNTASRLEEATKTCGADIVIGESTAVALPHFAILQVGEVTLRGKAKPERIFALVGDETMKSSFPFQDLADRHASLLAAVCDGDTMAGAAALDACVECRVPGTEAIYRCLRSKLGADAL
jgi:adenylate cyclase